MQGGRALQLCAAQVVRTEDTQARQQFSGCRAHPPRVSFCRTSDGLWAL